MGAGHRFPGQLWRQERGSSKLGRKESKKSDGLGQDSANFSYEGPHRSYPRLCRTQFLPIPLCFYNPLHMGKPPSAHSQG